MPNRVLVQIGPISIYWYGVLIMLGVLLATSIAGLLAKRKGDDPEHIWNALVPCLVLGVIGGRLYHVVSALPYYLQHPDQIFGLQMAGFGIYGSVAGGALGLWLYTRYAHLRFWRWADYTAPGLLVAQAIGRWGNFFNQELYGYPTNPPWGIYIAPQNRLPGYEQYSYFFPTFLLESVLLLISFGVMMYLGRKLSGWLKEGDMFLFYGILYPVVRFITEFERPDAWKIAGVPTAQWIAGLAFIVCASVLWLRHRKRAVPPEAAAAS
ncbi:MAG: prolipoprotein diacylglyceryl transferase [Anaerolineae bacterium]